MKYSSKNKPPVCMQTQSTCYKGTSKMTIKGILIHDTAGGNPYLKRYVQPSDNAPDKEYWLNKLGKNQYNNDWNHCTRQAGLNCWVGKFADGTIGTVQTMPWDNKPWGCGSGKNGSCNNGWIQFECCDDGYKSKDYFEAVYKEACEIIAYLCKEYNIDPKGTVVYNGVKVPTILCHYDSYKLGLGCNHGDIYGWFNKYGKNMETVRNDVAKLIQGDKPQPAPTPTPTGYPGTLPTKYPAVGYYKLGDKSDEVKKIQSFLNWYDKNYKFSATGVVDEATDMAMKDFQYKEGLIKNFEVGSAGLWGPKSTNAAAAVKAPTTKTNTYQGTYAKLPTKPNYFKKGDKGEEVKKLQRYLNWYKNYNLTVNGTIDTKTDNAMRDFQLKEGLIKSLTDSSAGLWGPKSQDKAKAVKK